MSAGNPILLPKLARVGALALGITLLDYAFSGLYSYYRQTHNPRPLPVLGTVSTADTSVDETAIDPHSAYDVPADQPRYIDLPTIKAAGYIQQVGVTSTQAMAVPTNVNLAGWYNASAKPGEEGLSIMNGHITGNYVPGIFRHLSELKTQDIITVEYGDSSKRSFKVISIREYSLTEINAAMFAKLSGISRQLNLITCSGTYDTKAHTYSSRTLVVAEAL